MDLISRINFWDLTMEKRDEKAFHQHASTISTYRSWYASASVCGLMVNMAMWRYFPRQVTYPKGLNILLIQQLLQLGLLAFKPEFFHRIRVPLMIINRLLRLINTAQRFWPSEGSLFTTTFGYFTGNIIIGTHCPSRAAAMVALIEPMLSVTHSMFHLLPFRLHIVFALLRAVIDIALVMPGLACIMLRPEIQQIYGLLCNKLGWQDIGADGGSTDLGVCSKDGRAWFVPPALLLIIGQLLPLMLHYWLELRLKLQFLLNQPVQTPQPGSPAAAAAAAAAAVAEEERAWLTQQARRKVLRLCFQGLAMSISYALLQSI